MADRDGERVGGVMRRRLDVEREYRPHHALHLRLVGAAVAAHRLLDRRGRVLDARHLVIRARDERGSARLAHRQRRPGIETDVRLLERDHLGRVAGNQLRNLVVDALEPHLGLLAGRGRPPPVVDADHAAALPSDDAEAARSRAGVDPEDRHSVRLGAVPDVPAPAPGGRDGVRAARVAVRNR